ncbi:MAG: M16 family metallopeptidase [Fusobacteriaceae bacterium]
MQKRLFHFNFILSIFFIFSIITYSDNLKNSQELLTGTLNNGLKYYILKNQYPQNKASLNLVVNSGSLEENDTEEGVAHFLEHMAFNGTNLYPKNDLISYFQSIGLKFGDDLNAYTSYDETVYMLDVSTKDDKNFNTALNVLKEWAFFVTLNEDETQKEKNIILEEWRTKQGVKNKISTLKRNALFGESVFAKRLPIGSFESISNINSNTLKKYYNKLYTPNRMAIIAVGDFDPVKVEQSIKNNFSISKKFNEVNKVHFTIKDTKNQTIIFRDKEITTTTLSLSKTKKLLEENNEENIKENLVQYLYFNILNNRIDILRKKENSPFNEGKIFSYPISKGNEIVEFYLSLKENKILKGYEEVLFILKSLSVSPPNINELENEKKDILSNLKLSLTNKNSIENSNFIDEIKDVFLLNSIFLNPQDKYALLDKILKDINVNDIQNYSKSFSENEKITFLTIPEKESLNNITKEELVKVQEKVKATLPPSFSYSENKELVSPNLIPGKIIKKEIIDNNSDFKTISYTLSNGINVIYKETNFEKDKVFINFFKEKNTSTYSKKQYFNSLFTPYMLSNSGVGNLNPDEFEQFKKGKNFSVSPYLRDYTEGFEIISDNENLSTSLNVMNLLIQNKRFDDTTFNNLKERTKEKIVNQNNSPVFNFSKTITSTLFKNNYRRQPLTSSDLSLIKKSEIEKLYKQNFNNFYGYNLVVVGSITEDILQKYLTDNFASLPSKEMKKEITPLNITLENNKVEKTVIQGEDEKSRVSIIYPYQGVYSNRNKSLYNSFSQLLDIILVEKIREKSGQVYSIYSDASLEYYNFNENYLSINFTTDNKNVENVLINLKGVLKEISEGKFDQNKLNDIIENYTISYDTELKKNDFWYSYLHKKTLLKDKDYHLVSPKELKEILTPESLKEFIMQAMNQDKYIQVVLKPEKFENNK